MGGRPVALFPDRHVVGPATTKEWAAQDIWWPFQKKKRRFTSDMRSSQPPDMLVGPTVALRALQERSLGDQVFDQLAAEIMSERYATGVALPAERALAEIF